MHNRQPKQQGITLIMALIMMTVLSTIGITIANIATTDLRITNNIKTAQQAKMAAESGLDTLVADIDRLEEYAPHSWTNSPTEILPAGGYRVDGPNNEWSATVTVARMGDPIDCPVTSDGESSSMSRCVFFEIRSEGLTARGGKAELRRGFARKIRLKAGG